MKSRILIVATVIIAGIVGNILPHVPNPFPSFHPFPKTVESEHSASMPGIRTQDGRPDPRYNP